MNSVIIFDVSNGAEAIVREKLRAMGYFYNWTYEDANGQKNLINLPHNVIWKANTESEQAIADIRQAIESINVSRFDNKINLLRCVVLNSTPWRGLFGVPVA